MPVSPIERRVGLAAVASLVLAVTPTRAVAAPPSDPVSSESTQPSEPKPEPESGQSTSPEVRGQTPPGGHHVPPQSTSPGASEASGANKEQPRGANQQPEVTEVEHRDVQSGGGVAGAIVDPDDPNATRAQSDLEGESLDEVSGVPDRVPRLQAAGWWTTFAAVALATSGGIFAGVAEVRQDEAERLAYSFDLLSGRTTTYGPVASEYERLLDEGHTYQWVARGLIIAGGAALVASIGLFAADAAQRRKSKRSSSARAPVRWEPGLGSLTLRF